jgi:ferredoxin
LERRRRGRDARGIAADSPTARPKGGGTRPKKGLFTLAGFRVETSFFRVSLAEWGQYENLPEIYAQTFYKMIGLNTQMKNGEAVNGSVLRKIRQWSAFICFTCITLLFLDFTGTLHGWFGWLARIQFLPALLALNAGVVGMLVLLTLFLGRAYCSVICPLGVWQDVVSRIASRRKKRRFFYSPALSRLRYGMLALFAAAFAGGISSVVALFDPYGAYGRMAGHLLAPLYLWMNNLLAYLAERMDSYAFYSVDVWLKSAVTLSIAAVTLVAIIVLAWRGGRTYCNTICPVGTILGFFARYSLFRMAIDAGKCNQCSLCARNCKAACINYKEYKIDTSRCVACMNCAGVCKQGAISYTMRYAKAKKEGEGRNRRVFLSAALAALASSVLKAQEKRGDGGFAVILPKEKPARQTPLAPPGSQGMQYMARRCTACQLCVSVCPNQVLRPSGSLRTWMQPEMSYERGYCRPECVKCSEVCPAGAIQPVTAAEKSAIQIGHAVWVKKNCISLAKEVACGNCARHCPAEAIRMIPVDAENAGSLTIPAINTERCIGCGACENVCPSRPLSAIYVEGHERHRMI